MPKETKANESGLDLQALMNLMSNVGKVFGKNKTEAPKKKPKKMAVTMVSVSPLKKYSRDLTDRISQLRKK